MERNASGMWILYQTILDENQENDAMQIYYFGAYVTCQVLMIDLKGICTNVTILTNTKDREHKYRKFQGKVT